MKIRQSLLGSFDACPRRLQYELEAPKDQYRSGIVRAVGTAYHAGLEYYYRSVMRGDSFSWHEFRVQFCQDTAVNALEDEIARAGDAFIWDDKFKDFDAAAETVRSMLAAYFEGGHAWPAEWAVLGVEETFEFPFHNGHTRSGTIDLVLQDPNGWIYDVDHKTAGRKWDQGKHKPRKNNQAPFYTAALQQMYPEAPGWRFVFDVMTYKGEFERRISDPQPGHIQAVLDKSIQVISLYEGMRANGLDLPVNPSSNLCSPRYCDFWDICPSGSALDGQDVPASRPRQESLCDSGHQEVHFS